jgi:serine/threonine protein phosphatase PrpC
MKVFHGRGENCRYANKPSEDAVVYGSSSNITNVQEANHYLIELDKNLSKAVDNNGEFVFQTPHVRHPGSTWSGAVVLPSGEIVYGTRGDSQLTLFIYDEKTKAVEYKILNNLHNLANEKEYLEKKGDNKTKEEIERLAKLNDRDNRDNRIGRLLAISRTFGYNIGKTLDSFNPKKNYEELGGLRQSEFDTHEFARESGKKYFLMNSSDGMFEPMLAANQKIIEENIPENTDYTFTFTTLKGEKIEAALKAPEDKDSDCTKIFINNEDVTSNTDPFSFKYDGIEYSFDSQNIEAVHHYNKGKKIFPALYIEGTSLIQQYAEIIAEKCKDNKEAEIAVSLSNLAKTFSTDDLSFTFMDITIAPQNALVTHIFDGHGGQEVSKKCADLTAEFIKGCNIEKIVAESKDAPEINNTMPLELEVEGKDEGQPKVYQEVKEEVENQPKLKKDSSMPRSNIIASIFATIGFGAATFNYYTTSSLSGYISYASFTCASILGGVRGSAASAIVGLIPSLLHLAQNNLKDIIPYYPAVKLGVATAVASYLLYDVYRDQSVNMEKN